MITVLVNSGWSNGDRYLHYDFLNFQPWRDVGSNLMFCEMIYLREDHHAQELPVDR